MADALPDILRSGLRVVFCGTAAGTASARVGAYYAGPGNAFWATLHSTGLTPTRLSPTEFERLPDFGIGLTDICKALHGSDQEVGTNEFDVVGLEARIAAAEPSNLAFNGKNAARGALGHRVLAIRFLPCTWAGFRLMKLTTKNADRALFGRRLAWPEPNEKPRSARSRAPIRAWRSN